MSPHSSSPPEEFIRRVERIRAALASDPSLIMVCDVPLGARHTPATPSELRDLLLLVDGPAFGRFTFWSDALYGVKQFWPEDSALYGCPRIGQMVDTPLLFRDGRIFTYRDPDDVSEESVIDLGPFWEVLLNCVGPGYAPEESLRDDWWDAMERLGLLD